MRIKIICILSCVCVFFASCLNENKKEHTQQNKKRVIAYIAGWTGFDVSKVDASKLTHINYAFANIIDGKAVFELDVDSLNLSELSGLKNENPKIKILYSVGGWVWSENFSDVAVSEASRKKFAQSTVQLMLKHHLDGIDLDWEYPAQRAEDNIYRPSDKENFTLLLKEIRQQLNNLDKDYLLTIATGANQAYIDNTNLGEAQKYLDFINIMAYDFYHGWHYQTGHHANFKPSLYEKFGGNSVTESVKRHLKAGVPADKLVVGVPFYGRLWTGVNPQKNGLYQNAKSAGVIIGFNAIQDSINKGAYQLFWDESANAPYLWNVDNEIFISYENTKSLRLKINYIKEQNLGGLMFWEYSLDNGELLEELTQSIYNKN